MKIYHGTNIEFGAIDLNLCPPDRDFGQGFYCTNIKKHAQERAKEKAKNEPIRYKIEELVTNLAVELIKDYDFSTTEAMKAVYDSDIFTQLADETTKLYEKDWNEIYKLLLHEKNI